MAGKTRPAPRVVTMPASAFSPKWKNAPGGPLDIGLRLVPEATNDFATAEALRIANDHYPPERRDSDEYIVHYNAEVMRHILAHACVDPADVTRPVFAKAPEAEFAQAMTDGGARRLWHEYLELRDRMDPTTKPATDADLARLAEALVDGPRLALLTEQDRRVLGRMLDVVG